MKSTLDQIAKATGFAKSTVSRVLSGKGDESRISPETIARIRREADKVGYVPNFVAKKMREERTHTIGLVVPSISNPYFAEMASVIITAAQRFGYITIVAATMEDEDAQKSSVASLISRKVDGFIIVPCGSDPAFLEQTNEDYTPVVLVDRYYEGSSLPYVVTNNRKGGYDATKVLLGYGHKDILCIQGPPSVTPNKERITGYMSAMKEAGLEEKVWIVGNEFSVQNGYLETKLVLNNKAKQPTAIFALSNTIALGTIKAICEAGLRIPDDISLISYDNNLFLDYMSPSVTRIGQMVKEMGKMAVKLVMESIATHRPVKTQIELSPETILRNSVGPVG